MKKSIHSNLDVTGNSKQIDVLKKNFPQCFDKYGDFMPEKLQDLVTQNSSALSKESYGLNWLGKSYARLLANEHPRTLLSEDQQHNAKPENQDSENLLIKGDNLEVLKHLVNAYSEQVKMIYIDPPYNTGSDGFVYEDDRKFSPQQLSELAGIDSDEAKRILSFTQSKANSHSAWLTFMYPRLYVARELLKDDGVIFISIDDNEVAQLKILCDEVFGEHNLASQLVWNTEGNTDNQYRIKVKHEYILVYYKRSEKSGSIGYVIDPNTPKDSNLRKGFADNNINKNNPENPPATINLPVGFPSSVDELSYPAKSVDEFFFNVVRKDRYISDTIKERYQIENKSGLPVKLDNMSIKSFKLTEQCRIFGGFANGNKLLEFIKNDCKPISHDGGLIEFYINSNAAVRYRKKREKARNIISVLRGVGTTEKNKTNLKGMGIPFSYPKPLELLKYLIQIGAEADKSHILDFFAGSGTTAHAVMQLNAEDGGTRQCISVQIDEPTDKKSEAYKAGYKTIFDITQARIEKSAQKIKQDNPAYEGDLGFKIFATKPLSEAYLSDMPTLSSEQQTLPLISNELDDILVTWKVYDGISLTQALDRVDLAGYTAHYHDRICYLMQSGFSSDALIALLQKLDDTDDAFQVEKLVVNGSEFDSKYQREIAEAVTQYKNKKDKHISVEFRY